MKVKLLKKVRKHLYFRFECDYYFQWAAYSKESNKQICRGIGTADVVRRSMQHVYGFEKGLNLFRTIKHNK